MRSKNPCRYAGRVATAILALAAPLAGCSRADANPVDAARADPVLLDERLDLSLFASDPDIATPIGIAVDDRDRVFVLESHTHLPPTGYAGPSDDRVKVFVDVDRDGRADRSHVYADGIDDGMNLAFSPAGELFVVAARAVWALHDRDGDGVSEARTRVLHLSEPAQVYDHAALLGITFGPDGWLYVSRGNTGGQAWRLEGTDGSSLSGYGDGGNVVRVRPDGTGLEEVATGFWNPFDLKFDSRGRLLAADNDPDSRGPNRLVHVIAGGDYGYRSLYGESGIHPFLAWNGELPGTLPYVAALGEAPSGVLNADLAALPEDYRGNALVTIWEEGRIVRVRTAPRGASISGETEVVVQGGADFRPVALAADRQGNVYVTDWVVRAYPNHGKGRVWRLSPKAGVRTLRPRAPLAAPDDDPGGSDLRAIEAAAVAGDFATLRSHLVSTDPFLRSAAVTAAGQERFRAQLLRAAEDSSADLRLGALLALRRLGSGDAVGIARRFLSDADPRVRRMALVWSAGAGLTALAPDLSRATATGDVDPELFEAYIAAVAQTTPEFAEAYRTRAERYAKNLPRALPADFLPAFIADRSRPAALRAVAVRYLDRAAAHRPLLLELARTGGDRDLRVEAIRSLAFAGQEEARTALAGLAAARGEPAEIRVEALASLARNPGATASAIQPLLADPDPEVRVAAARVLRVARPASPAEPAPPTDAGQWAAAATAGGDPERGRGVFFSPRAACAECHVVERRGGDLGPDLSNVGRSKSREQLIRSITHPSEAIAPEYQGWFVRTADGATHYGRQIDVGDRGADLYVPPGRFISIPEFVAYGPAERSLMPEGLHQQLTVEEFRDLIAFLEQRR